MILALSLYVAILQRRVASRDKVIGKEAKEVAAALGGADVQIANQKALIAALSASNKDFVAGIQAKAPSAVPVVHFAAIATEVEPAQNVVLEHLKPVPVSVTQLAKPQVFRLDGVILRNANGKLELGQITMDELDPDTGRVLPKTFHLESKIQVSDSVANLGGNQSPVLHPRLVGGVDQHGFPLLGVELVNGERFGGILAHMNLSVFGVYDVKNKTASVGSSLMWRLWNSNVSLGPAVFWRPGHTTLGAAATIEITR